jgi:hypothetical protein
VICSEASSLTAAACNNTIKKDTINAVAARREATKTVPSLRACASVIN